VTALPVQPGVTEEIRLLQSAALDALLDASRTRSEMRRSEKIALAIRLLLKAARLGEASTR